MASNAPTPTGSVQRSRVVCSVGMCVQLKRWRVSCGYLLQRGHSGDGCEMASTLCRYVLRKGDLFVLNWARVRRM